MDLTSTESYTYNSTLVRNHLTNPKLKDLNASSFLHLLKILEKDKEKEGAPVENYDFAGNLPLLISYLFTVKSKNAEIYNELIQLLQVGLSELTKKCRGLQNTITEQDNGKGSINISSLILDTSALTIDTLNANARSSLSNEKSEVTIAHDKKKNYYAIKRFKRNIELADKQKSFLRNVSIYSQLSHYSILPFVGINLYSRSDGRNFYPSIITKYEKKKSLFDLLFKTTNKFYFSDTQKMIVLLGVATALKNLHKNGITHGNLKPSNVLISSKYEPFVSDFFNSHLDPKDPTSVAFIAPEILIFNEQKLAATKTSTLTKSTSKTQSATTTEQLDNSKKKESKYTKEADVYSFGMIAYSVLSSQPPFASESLQPKNVIKKVITGNRPTIPSYLPSNYVGLIEHCWKNEPSDRPTIKEIVDFISESKPLPETDIIEFSEYLKKVRPHQVLPSLVQVQNQKDQHTEESDAKAKQKLKQKISDEIAKSKSSNFDDSEVYPDPDNLKDPEAAYQSALKLKSRSITQSNIFMKRSAELGHIKGEVEYGKYLLDDYTDEYGNASEPSVFNNKNGEPVLKLNEVWAAHYFKLAANHEDPEALYLYGRCLYYGIGVYQNYSKAAKYLKRAASMGNKDAQYLYGLCLKEGNGVPQNIPLAIKYFKDAELNDVASARRQLNELSSKH